MARQYDYGNNQILRPEFLNVLQKILQSYLDIFMLERSGNQVLAPATLDDPISVNIDRRMRRVSVSLATVVTGVAGTKDVFFSIYNDGVHLEVLPQGNTPVGAQAWRHVGEAQFNGTSVTSVTTYTVRSNADMLIGRSSSYEPYPYAIPVADENGRLHPDWFPEVSLKVEMVGTIRRQWLAPGQALDLGTDWVVMQGQSLDAGLGQHSFPGGGVITLPNMLNKTARGASLAFAAGTAGTPTTAPGLGGLTGANAGVNLSHVHTVSSHDHSGIPDHTHAIPDHNHQHVNHSHQELVNEPLDFLPGATSHTIQSGVPVTQGAGVLDTGPPVAKVPAGNSINSANTLPLGTRTTSSVNDGPSTSELPTSLASVDVRPAHVGLIYLVKVH